MMVGLDEGLWYKWTNNAENNANKWSKYNYEKFPNKKNPVLPIKQWRQELSMKWQKSLWVASSNMKALHYVIRQIIFGIKRNLISYKLT